MRRNFHVASNPRFSRVFCLAGFLHPKKVLLHRSRIYLCVLIADDFGSRKGCHHNSRKCVPWRHVGAININILITSPFADASGLS